MLTYLDSSAIVKLVIREAETDALLAYLGPAPRLASSSLARTEVLRAVTIARPSERNRASQVVHALHLIALDDPLLDAAGALGDQHLRSLDAIHLAAAQALGHDLEAIITYDHRMARAAATLGLPVATPR
ncbi:MAG: type II toxin-antitoxin system VapC family toxin [Patulibacter sp.]